MFRRNRNRKLKVDFDEKLRTLMIKTKEQWEMTKEIEKHSDDYDQDVIIQRKIAESKHFYLFKEAKARNLRSH